jgi:hypothetical protein
MGFYDCGNLLEDWLGNGERGCMAEAQTLFVDG